MAVVPMPDPRVRPGEPGSEPSISSLPDETPEEAREAKKREKVRAAWISFAGRIVAQVVGAMVTVALTLVVVQKVQLQQQPAPQADLTAATTRSPEAASTAPGPMAGPMPVPAARAEPVIAVLPLDDYSSSPKQHAFADGMMEALIAQLARNQAVRVISRTSSLRYRGSGKTLPAIARELGATLVVEGSIARDGGRIRVTAQLIDAATDIHVWAGTYDRHGEDLTVQAELAAAIARDMVASLGVESQHGVVDPRIAN
jgi:TolB-like protein